MRELYDEKGPGGDRARTGPPSRMIIASKLEARVCGQSRGGLGWQIDSGPRAAAVLRRSGRYTNLPDTTVVFHPKAKTLRSERLHQQLAHDRSIKPYSLPEGCQINGPRPVETGQGPRNARYRLSPLKLHNMKPRALWRCLVT